MKQFVTRSAVGWRISLGRECWFYWRACKNWRAVWSCRLHNAPLDEIQLRNGIVFRVAAHDARSVILPMLREVWREHVYTRHYARVPGVVADVGAHVGCFALYAARRWPQAHILALEPAPSNYARLAQNCERNRAVRVTALPLAAARANGQAELILTGQSDAHSLYAGSGAARVGAASVSVQTVDLDGLLQLTPRGKIDFLKLDCEGAEYDFLSCGKILKEHVGYVAVEYHEWSGQTGPALASILHDAGFEVRSERSRRLPTGMMWGVNPGFPNKG